MNYFENVYLGKRVQNDSLKTSRRLQKLMTVKALTSSIDSRKLNARDLKKLNTKKMDACKIAEVDFESYIRPYEVI
ncbi:MAG TPA: hypothetical protein VGF30_02075 [Bacteroidia bacterium]